MHLYLCLHFDFLGERKFTSRSMRNGVLETSFLIYLQTTKHSALKTLAEVPQLYTNPTISATDCHPLQLLNWFFQLISLCSSFSFGSDLTKAISLSLKWECWSGILFCMLIWTYPLVHSFFVNRGSLLEMDWQEGSQPCAERFSIAFYSPLLTFSYLLGPLHSPSLWSPSKANWKDDGIPFTFQTKE